MGKILNSSEGKNDKIKKDYQERKWAATVVNYMESVREKKRSNQFDCAKYTLVSNESLHSRIKTNRIYTIQYRIGVEKRIYEVIRGKLYLTNVPTKNLWLFALCNILVQTSWYDDNCVGGDDGDGPWQQNCSATIF